ncbi:O-antigen ligase family protein [Shewanella hanedai]
MQLGFIFLFLLYDFNKIDLNLIFSSIRRLLFFYYLFVLVLIYFFYFKSELYVSFMTVVFPESIPMLLVNLQSQRFSFHFTDPNAFGYMIVITLAFLLSMKLHTREFVFFVICALIIILTTQSRGAMISCGLVFLSYFLFIIKSKRLKIYFIFMLIVIISIIYFIWGEYLDIFFSVMNQRSEIEASMGAGVGGGRIESWFYFINNINYNPFFGSGYMLQRDGELYRPHSDFIRLNLSYGILIYFLFSYIFIGFRKKHIMLFFAFLIPFFINTIIDDYRLFATFIIFYSLIRTAECTDFSEKRSLS